MANQEPGSEGSVLVVDDDAINRRVLEATLRAAGYATTHACDGPQALLAAQNSRFDAVILDLMMPGMDGFEVCRQFKASRQLQDVPILFFSARDDKHSRASGLDLGGVDFLVKTTSREELLARLRRHTATGRHLSQLSDDKKRIAAAAKASAAELDEAGRLQRHWLPLACPQWNGYRFAIRHLPCQRVAGDILGIVDCADGARCVYLLDVSGHGPAAAIVAGVASFLMESALAALPLELALSRVEREFPADRYERYFTAACAKLWPNGMVEVSRAGHPPPILQGRSGLSLLETGGAPIGLGLSDGFPTETLRMESGSRLLLYTDGLSEAKDQSGQSFGPERVGETLSSSLPLPPEACLDRIYCMAAQHAAPSQPADDIAMMLISFEGAAA